MMINMYDDMSSNYDRFMNWPARLAFELPFLEGQLAALANPEQPIRVLDAACGTGMHAIALAGRGYCVSGADLSPGMIDQARAHTTAAGLPVDFHIAGFGSLAGALGGQAGRFDALLCLGNSLPHVLSPAELAAAFADFAACLRPGGLLLVQNRNFEAILAARQRWMEPQPYQEGDKEWLFIRFYDYLPGGLIDFNFLTLQRSAGGTWGQSHTTTRLRPQTAQELLAAVAAAGFDKIETFGGMDGSPFDPAASPNLILTARKSVG